MTTKRAATRRAVLKGLALTVPAVALPGSIPSLLAAEEKPAAAAGGKTLLVLGGTMFLGPEIVEAALARGWKVTLFNRGKTNPQLFPDLEKLHGDRDPAKGDGLKSLEGRRWDAVVDTSGYVPRHVQASASLLAPVARQYVFVSTISVYADNSKPGADETAAVGTLKDPAVEKVDGETYGPLKALCEQAAEKAMPGRTTIVRPGLIVGPNDPSDRFTYWPVRVAKGGEVLAPGTPQDATQFFDVRDLGNWIVLLLEKNRTGVFNATGPKEPLPMGELLASCKRVSGSDAAFTWVPSAFLEAQQVAPWSDMPVWVPPVDDMAGFARVGIARATAAGLTFRPVDDTVRDTLAWWKTVPEERRAKMRAGLGAAREAEVLAAWRAQAAKAKPEPGAGK
jgi:2'-hydroxyisoflavone reductase